MTVNSTKDPIILSDRIFSHWVQSEIDTLPARQQKTFKKVIREGIPLNRRMQRIWHDVQMFADAAEMSNWLAENDSWGME
jgi:hypothetical protein